MAKDSGATRRANIAPRRAKAGSVGLRNALGRNSVAIAAKAGKPPDYVGSDKGPMMPIYCLSNPHVLDALMRERWAQTIYQQDGR